MKWLTLLFAYSLEAFLNDEDNYIEGWRRAKRVLVIAVKQMVLHRGITLGLLLTGISTLTPVIVEGNQSANVYPWNADSIGIPIFGTWFLSLLISPFLLLVAFLPRTLKGIYSLNSGLGARVVGIFAVSISYLPCLYFSLYGSLYWTSPNHMSIAFWFYLASAYLLFLVFKDLSTILKEKSFE